MDEQTRERLKQTFNYASWENARNDGARRSIAALAVPGARLDGWTAQRVSPIRVSGATAAYRSMWRSADSADAIVSLELIEAPEAHDARELLLELLGEFESPLIEGRQQNVTGDVAFAMPGDTAMLFARANVVAMVRNAGRDVVPVVNFARQVDQTLG